MAHLRFGDGTWQLSILVNEAAELAGEPLNIMATAILRAYLGGTWAAGGRLSPEIMGWRSFQTDRWCFRAGPLRSASPLRGGRWRTQP